MKCKYCNGNISEKDLNGRKSECCNAPIHEHLVGEAGFKFDEDFCTKCGKQISG